MLTPCGLCCGDSSRRCIVSSYSISLVSLSVKVSVCQSLCLHVRSSSCPSHHLSPSPRSPIPPHSNFSACIPHFSLFSAPSSHSFFSMVS